MNDVDRALSQIEDIQAHLAASTRFRGIAPDLNALTGVFALAVATAQSLWPQVLAKDTLGYVVVWASVIFVFAGAVATEAVTRAHQFHGPLAKPMLATALRKIVPYAAAGVVLTWAICQFAIESAWLLPGIWLILPALAGWSALANLPPAMIWAVAWYFVSGTAVLAIAGPTGLLSPWMLGLPIGIGQLLVAFILHRADGQTNG